MEIPIKKIEVCEGKKCKIREVDMVFEQLKIDLKENPEIELTRCLCLGQCSQGPNVIVDETRILQYSKARTIWDRIKIGEGEKYIRMDEDAISDDFLGDV
ncbi:MAG: (2Fe-2S) ferredoxin domain-containing protein [Candidatus Magasanikbacteria bacterium]|nr:(2Fe-2S) ferredoxin domain-containing protein [Candidatus Magasanikbacteria bacterium]